MTIPQVLFAGTDEFAVAPLQSLVTIANVLAVITQPSRINKRLSNTSGPNPIIDVAAKLGITYYAPEKISSIIDQIKSLAPDIIVVADYGQIIPPSILSIPIHGGVNIHPSLLPKYRGPSPIPAAILSHDRATGVSIIRMDDQMDHGPILAQLKYPLRGDETASDLEHSLSITGAQLLIDTIKSYLTGTLQPVDQAHEQATYTALLKRSDGELASNDTAEIVGRKCRAYAPWPGLWFKYNLHGQTKIIKLLEVRTAPFERIKTTSQIFLLVWHQRQLYLQLKEGAVIVNRLQVEGGRELSGNDFYRGYHSIIPSIN